MSASNALWTQITRHLSLKCEEDQVFVRANPISGGDIAEAYRLECRTASFFVKLQARKYLAMFESEYLSLQHISNELSLLNDKTLGACPRPICVGNTETQAFLVMEYIEFSGKGNEAELGRLVASLHRIHNQGTNNGVYGWQQDNFIGLTPQANAWSDNWTEFFWRQRIQAQLNLASSRAGGQKFCPYYDALEDKVMAALNHQPQPSLLHGDLWSGNKAYSKTGTPVIFDPAAYYGDAETDLALSELFGGFSDDFYHAYYREHPQQIGYEGRRDIYQLYHMLNHFNLFGQSYLSPCLRLIEKIVE